MEPRRHKKVFVLALLVGICLLGFGALGRSEELVGGDSREGDTLIKNASTVLTMDPSRGDQSLLGLLQNADVLIMGDRIGAVGNVKEPPKGARVIDGRGMIVMPGFVDTHDHLWQSVLRGCATDQIVSGWFRQCVRPLNLITDPKQKGYFSDTDAYAAERLSTVGLIDTGVTTVTDWSNTINLDFVHGSLRALNDSGLRYAFAMIPNDPTGASVKAVKAEYIDGNPLGTLQIAVGVGPDLAGAVAIAKELGVKLHVHLLENLDQRQSNPFQILENSGALALGPDFLAAHAIHLIPSEIAELAANGNSVSHQPLSNMRLASGIFDYTDIKNAGIRIGLGLDGGANDTTDFFNNMRAAVGLQRALKAGDPSTSAAAATTSPTVEEILRVATLGGAEVLGMDSAIGSLTPGKQADIIVIDTKMINFAPVLKPAAQLVFNGQPQNVKWVFIAGRARMVDGKVTGVNVRKVIDAAQKASDDITSVLKP